MKAMLFVLAVLSLGACAQPQPADFARTCESYGFRYATPEFSNCVMRLHQASLAEPTFTDVMGQYFRDRADDGRAARSNARPTRCESQWVLDRWQTVCRENAW